MDNYIITGETISLANNMLNLISSTETGRLMFQFDDDEPQELAVLMDYAAVSFTLKQKPGLSDECNSIGFTSDTGKKFKIYIKKTLKN